MSHAGITGMRADPISLRLNGPGGWEVLLTPGDGTPIVTPRVESSVQAAATVTSTTADFLSWSTQRLPWSNLVHIDGDQHVAAEFLNAVNLNLNQAAHSGD